MRPTFKFALREDLKNDKRFLPTKAEPMATGWDVSAAIKTQYVINPGQWVKIPLGFRMFAPYGWWMELRPRSSTTAKKKMHALYGVLDQDFFGEVIFTAQYIPEEIFNLEYSFYEDDKKNEAYSYAEKLTIDPGDRIGQIIPVRRQEMIVEEVSNEEYSALAKARGGVRGEGGHGSTGK